MAQLKPIEIDFDIYKLIEAERQSFTEVPYQILRRLLKLPETKISKAAPSQGLPWVSKGVTLQHGTKLRASYNNVRVTGVVSNGMWEIKGKRFKSPSQALGSSVTTAQGQMTSLNGWVYWEVQLLGSNKWQRLNKLRQEAEEIIT